MAGHSLLLLDETGFRWKGNELQLAELLDQLQIYGVWKDINFGRKFISEGNLFQFDWYPKKGKLMTQGAPLKKEQLTRIFQALIDNPDNLEFVKNLIKECKAAEKKSAEEVVGDCQDHEVITNFLNGVHQGSNIGRYVEYKIEI